MSALDWTLSVGAVVLMFAQGWWLSGRQKTAEDYFVGGRRMSWLAVGLSMFAATFSPLSFVGMPREAAYDNYHLYLAVLFIPLVVGAARGLAVRPALPPPPAYERVRVSGAALRP